MTESVNIAEAKAKLSALVDRVAAGEEIILCRAGRLVARLMPLAERAPRQPGILRHWQIPDDLFLEPADEDRLIMAQAIRDDSTVVTLDPVFRDYGVPVLW